MRIGLVVPHIFMQRQILPRVIFSPGQLAIALAENLKRLGMEVTLFSPGPVDTSVDNITADLSLFETELKLRGDGYMDLLRKHPFTFITLARQVQSELIAKAYAMANRDQFDIIHVYTNEEDTALPFAKLCSKPTVFTHHDPFNFLIRYKSVFPKYPNLNWLSLSMSQRQTMPKQTNWVGNIYNGLDADRYVPNYQPKANYVVYLGRIIEHKGIHLAIEAVNLYNKNHQQKLGLKIAGKHYGNDYKDKYWQDHILPKLNVGAIEYLGFLKDDSAKQDLLGNAAALIMPSTFEEPFGLVMIEALACATPIIGLESGSIPEIVKHGKNGWLAKKVSAEGTSVIDEDETAAGLARMLDKISSIDRRDCRQDFENRFTIEKMAQEHLRVYQKLAKG